MIAITRGEKPSSLKRSGAKWTRELCDLRRQYYRAQNTTLKKPEAIKSRYAAISIKTALKSMFGFKCAYCEGSVKAISYLHVEHFRPQSVYPAYAYDWNNLLYSCAQCNTTKGGQFPLGPNEQDAIENAVTPCAIRDNEDVLLVNPCVESPKDFFQYAFSQKDLHNIEAILVCRNRRAEITRDVCGLNREDLSDERRKHASAIKGNIIGYELATRLRSYEKQLIFAEKLRNHVCADAPYSAMARAFIVNECGIDIETLPR